LLRPCEAHGAAEAEQPRINDDRQSPPLE
jgi:hypothetical protein